MFLFYDRKMKASEKGIKLGRAEENTANIKKAITASCYRSQNK